MPRVTTAYDYNSNFKKARVNRMADRKLAESLNAVENANTKEVLQTLVRIATALESIDSTLKSVVGKRKVPNSGAPAYNVILTEDQNRR